MSPEDMLSIALSISLHTLSDARVASRRSRSSGVIACKCRKIGRPGGMCKSRRCPLIYVVTPNILE